MLTMPRRSGPFRGGRHVQTTAALLTLAPLLLAAPVPLLAQERDPPEITVIGLVVDRATQSPIAGVLVEVEETGKRVLTDSIGIFMIGRVSAGPKTFVFRQFGYIDTRLGTVARAGEAIRVEMVPMPIVLEGIAVNVDRLDLHRRATRVRRGR